MIRSERDYIALFFDVISLPVTGTKIARAGIFQNDFGNNCVPGMLDEWQRSGAKKITVYLYRVLKTGAVVWLDKMEGKDLPQFPDYRKVIPDTVRRTEKITYLGKETIFFDACVAANKAGGGGGYNSAYFADAIPALKVGREITFTGVDKLSPIRIDHDLGTAVVMPVRKS